MQEDILKQFAERLRELRAKKQFTLETVGDNLGIHRETMRKYESNPSTMTAETLLKLLYVYEEEPDIFFAKIYGKMP